MVDHQLLYSKAIESHIVPGLCIAIGKYSVKMLMHFGLRDGMIYRISHQIIFYRLAPDLVSVLVVSVFTSLLHKGIQTYNRI